MAFQGYKVEICLRTLVGDWGLYVCDSGGIFFIYASSEINFFHFLFSKKNCSIFFLIYRWNVYLPSIVYGWFYIIINISYHYYFLSIYWHRNVNFGGGPAVNDKLWPRLRSHSVIAVASGRNCLIILTLSAQILHGWKHAGGREYTNSIGRRAPRLNGIEEDCHHVQSNRHVSSSAAYH